MKRALLVMLLVALAASCTSGPSEDELRSLIREEIQSSVVQGLTGPEGVPGPEGQRGLEGPEGSQGTRGPEGRTGPFGTEGTQGIQGFIGN